MIRLRTHFDSVFDEFKDLCQKVKSAVSVDNIQTRIINCETYNEEENYRRLYQCKVLGLKLKSQNKIN